MSNLATTEYRDNGDSHKLIDIYSGEEMLFFIDHAYRWIVAICMDDREYHTYYANYYFGIGG